MNSNNMEQDQNTGNMPTHHRYEADYQNEPEVLEESEMSKAEKEDMEMKMKGEVEDWLRRRAENLENGVEEIAQGAENSVNDQEIKVIDNQDANIEDMEKAVEYTNEARKGIGEARVKILENILGAAPEAGKTQSTFKSVAEIWGEKKSESIGRSVGKTLLGVAGTWLGVRSPFEIKKWLDERKDKKQTTNEAKDMIETLKGAVNELRKKREGGDDVIKEESRKKAQEAVFQTREKIKNSNLSAQEKAELWRQVAHISREHQKSTESENNSHGQKVEKVMDAYIDTKTQGVRAVKESLNTIFMATGIPWMRLVAYTPLELYEKYAKSSQEISKKELKGEDVGKSSKLLETAKKVMSELSLGAAFAKKGRNKKEIAQDAIKGVGLWLRFIGLGEIASDSMDFDEAKDAVFHSFNSGSISEKPETADMDFHPSIKGSWNDNLQKNLDKVLSDRTDMATVHEGEGVEHTLIRQLKDSPSTHGFNGDITDKEAVEQWANAEAHKIAIKENFVDPTTGTEKGILFDEKNPTMILLKDDNSVELTNAKTYELKAVIPLEDKKIIEQWLKEDIDKIGERPSGFYGEKPGPIYEDEHIIIGEDNFALNKPSALEDVEKIGNEPIIEESPAVSPETEKQLESEVESSIEIGHDEKIAIEYFNKDIAEREKLLNEYQMKYGDRPEFKAFENEVKAGIDLEKHSVELAQKGEAHPRVSGNMDPETFAKMAIESVARKMGLLTGQEYRDLQFKELDKF